MSNLPASGSDIPRLALFVTLLALVACTNVNPAPTPSAAEPAGTAAEESATTPPAESSSTKPPVQAATTTRPSRVVQERSASGENWAVYENHEFGFRINYPPDFFITEWDVGPLRLFYISFTAEKWRDTPTGVPGIELVVYPNPDEQPLAEWFSDRADVTDQEDIWHGVFLNPAQVELSTLGNYPILRAKTGVTAPLQRAFVAQGSYVLCLAYPPEDEELETYYESMLSTLAFFER